MSDDPIVDETRAARERLVDRFNGDLDELWQHLQTVQETLVDRIVNRHPKPPATVERRISQ